MVMVPSYCWRMCYTLHVHIVHSYNLRSINNATEKLYGDNITVGYMRKGIYNDASCNLVSAVI